MKRIKTKKNGFTLLELLIVIGIVSITFSLTFPNFSNLSKKQQGESETLKVFSFIKLARSKAVNQDIYTTNTNPATQECKNDPDKKFIGYNLRFYTSGNNQIIELLLNCTNLSSPLKVQSLTLENIEVTYNSSNNFTLSFQKKYDAPKINNSPINSSIDLNIKYLLLNQNCKKITLYKTGVLELVNLSLPEC